MARRRIQAAFGSVVRQEKCYVKPGRLRIRGFTANDCARIVCHALERGVTQPEMNDALERCLERGSSEDCKEERKQLAEVSQMAMELIEGNTRDLKFSQLVASVVETGLAITARLARFLPAIGGPASIALALGARQVGEIEARITARIAANDATFAIVRRIAANNEQFLLRALR